MTEFVSQDEIKSFSKNLNYMLDVIKNKKRLEWYNYKIEFGDTDEEHWKVIPICSRYEASTFGRVRNKKTKKFIKKTLGNRGYKYNLVNNGDKQRFYYNNQIVGLTFIHNPENKPEINHKDRNPKNNNIKNLEWNTKQENMEHYFKSSKRKTTKIKLTILETKEEKVFNSIGECGKFIGYKHSTISHRLSGKVKDTKYKFEYLKPLLKDMKGESWKIIPEFPNYKCSNFGRIKNKTNKIMKLVSVNGYNSFQFCKKGKTFNRLVYTFIAKAFIPNPNKYKYVIHKGSNLDDNINNLEWSPIRKILTQDSKKRRSATRRKTYWNRLPENIKNIIERLPFPNDDVSYLRQKTNNYYYHIFRINNKKYHFKTINENEIRKKILKK